jgi:hypothetical protein
MFLRAFALVIAFLIIFEPILSLTYIHQKIPAIAVLIDNSASIGIKDKLGNRKEKLLEIAKSSILENISSKYETRFYKFSDKTSGVSVFDSLKFNGEETDISSSLEQVRKELIDKNFSGVILITDGQNNLGEDPVRFSENYDVTIYTIGIGDPSESKDLLISKIRTNDIVYAENKIPVEITVKNSGYTGEKTTLTLLDSGMVVDTRIIDLGKENLEQTETLYFTAKGEGLKKYEVTISNLNGELTERNNKKSFFVKILKSKIKVLLISGAPGYDHSYLKQNFSKDENIELKSFTQKKDGTFYEHGFNQSDVSKFDVVIFNGFSTNDSKSTTVEAIIKTIGDNDIPFFLIYGRTIEINNFFSLKEFLPINFKFSDKVEELAYFRLTSEGLTDPITRIVDDPAENLKIWNGLPPLFVRNEDVSVKHVSTIIAYREHDKTKRALNYPILISQKIGKQKKLVLLGYGLWRWSSLLAIRENSENVYRKFISNSVRWLATREDSKLVRISTDKNIYRSTENIEFLVQVYDENYKPILDAEVSGTIIEKRGDRKIDFIFNSMGEGRYLFQSESLPQGDYKIEVKANFKARELGSDVASFAVESFGLEFINTKMNSELLSRIADASNGKFYDGNNDGWKNIKNDLNFKPEELAVHKEWELWNKIFMLVIFIGILSIEWFIKKRSGMM